MAVRNPLKFTDNTGSEYSFSQLSNDLVSKYVDYAFNCYINNPSVYLSSTGGTNLGTRTDTWYVSGTAHTNATWYPDEATTNEPSTKSNTYANIRQHTSAVTAITDINNVSFPVFLNADNDLQAMSYQDMVDTFLSPAMQRVASSDYVKIGGGDASYSSWTVFVDTRANLGSFSSSSIGSAGTVQEHTATNATYKIYVKKPNINGAKTAITESNKLVKLDINGNAKIMSFGEMQTMFEALMRYAAMVEVGIRPRWNINGGGTNLGAMVDSRLSGVTGNYQQRFVNTNDYRAQEFPNGSFTNVATWRLKVELT